MERGPLGTITESSGCAWWLRAFRHVFIGGDRDNVLLRAMRTTHSAKSRVRLRPLPALPRSRRRLQGLTQCPRDRHHPQEVNPSGAPCSTVLIESSVHVVQS